MLDLWANSDTLGFLPSSSYQQHAKGSLLTITSLFPADPQSQATNTFELALSPPPTYLSNCTDMYGHGQTHKHILLWYSVNCVRAAP